MGTSLQDMLNERPVDREAVNAHKRRMLEDVLVHRLRELRQEAALTQVELAERLNVSQNRVSSIERGGIERTQIDTLRRYIEALGGSLHVEVELGDQRFQIA
jgi:transcriptional regulator with XRE-family HTH domain